MIVETSVFGNYEQCYEPKVLIIPVPYEYTTSFCKGTKNGPQAILNASVHMESFDDELWEEIKKIGINTANFVNQEFVTDKSHEPFKEVESAVRESLIKGCLPVVLGGEHSVSYGSIKAVYDLYPDISVLHLGAHSHLKSSFKNNKFNHKCTLNRVLEAMTDLEIVQVGIRGLSREEASWMEDTNPNIEVFFARDMNRWTVADIISGLNKNVYITFDFTALDIGIMPSVYDPIPGGLGFELALDILKNVCTFKNVLGIDFTGFTPIQNLSAPDSLACRLIYKTIGYCFARELGAFNEGNSALVTSEASDS